MEERIGELEAGKKDKRRLQPPHAPRMHGGGTGPMV